VRAHALVEGLGGLPEHGLLVDLVQDGLLLGGAVLVEAQGEVVQQLEGRLLGVVVEVELEAWEGGREGGGEGGRAGGREGGREGGG
jgi:hypothetical protein